VGMCLALSAAGCSCPDCRTASKQSFCSDVVFTFLASLQRTTLQAFLGMAGSIHLAFSGVHGSAGAPALAGAAAVAYVLGVSSVGSLLLEVLAPSLLRAGSRAPRCEAAAAREEQLAADGWTARQRTMTGSSAIFPRRFFRIGLVTESGAVIESQACPAVPLKDAVNMLAQAYLVDAAVFSDMVQKYAEGEPDDDPPLSSSATSTAGPGAAFASAPPSGYASVRQLPMYAGHEHSSPMASAMASQRPLGTGGGGNPMSTGGAWSYVRSRASVRRLVQSRALTPRAHFEADGSTAQPVEMEIKESGTDGTVRL